MTLHLSFTWKWCFEPPPPWLLINDIIRLFWHNDSINGAKEWSYCFIVVLWCFFLVFTFKFHYPSILMKLEVLTILGPFLSSQYNFQYLKVFVKPRILRKTNLQEFWLIWLHRRSKCLFWKLFFKKSQKSQKTPLRLPLCQIKCHQEKKEKVPLEKYATTRAKLIYENKITYLFFLPSG